MSFSNPPAHVARVDKQLDVTVDRSGKLGLLKAQVNLHTWMPGLIIIVLLVPQLQRWFAVE